MDSLLASQLAAQIKLDPKRGNNFSSNAMNQVSNLEHICYIQKTREGCGCFRGLCRSSAGKFRENSGKIAGKIFPNREMLQILGLRAPGKANLPETLGPHCRDLVPTFRAECFLKATVPAFSIFSDIWNVDSFTMPS